MSTATGKRRLNLKASRDNLLHLPLNDLFELPGRPHVCFQLRNYASDVDYLKTAELARCEVPFLFKAFEAGQIGPKRLSKLHGGAPRISTIHEYLDWTVTAQGANADDELDFGGFLVLCVLPRYKSHWPPPNHPGNIEGKKSHPALGAPQNPLPFLQCHGSPVSAATIRSGPGYLEIPFVATHEAKRGRGYGRCLLEAMEHIAYALKLHKLMLCSTNDPRVLATWSHLDFLRTTEEQMVEWDILHSDMVYLQNTVQMHKDISPPTAVYKSVILKHGDFKQRTYSRIGDDRLCNIPMPPMPTSGGLDIPNPEMTTGVSAQGPRTLYLNSDAGTSATPCASARPLDLAGIESTAKVDDKSAGESAALAGIKREEDEGQQTSSKRVATMGPTGGPTVGSTRGPDRQEGQQNSSVQALVFAKASAIGSSAPLGSIPAHAPADPRFASLRSSVLEGQSSSIAALLSCSTPTEAASLAAGSVQAASTVAGASQAASAVAGSVKAASTVAGSVKAASAVAGSSQAASTVAGSSQAAAQVGVALQRPVGSAPALDLRPPVEALNLDNSYLRPVSLAAASRAEASSSHQMLLKSEGDNEKRIECNGHSQPSSSPAVVSVGFNAAGEASCRAVLPDAVLASSTAIPLSSPAVVSVGVNAAGEASCRAHPPDAVLASNTTIPQVVRPGTQLAASVGAAAPLCAGEAGARVVAQPTSAPASEGAVPMLCAGEAGARVVAQPTSAPASEGAVPMLCAGEAGARVVAQPTSAPASEGAVPMLCAGEAGARVVAQPTSAPASEGAVPMLCAGEAGARVVAQPTSAPADSCANVTSEATNPGPEQGAPKKEKSFKQFCEKPENEHLVEKAQLHEIKQTVKLRDSSGRAEFERQVEAAGEEVTRNLAPFMKNKVLRRIVQTFCNSPSVSLKEWATNPRALDMLGQALKLLEEERIAESELERLILMQLKVALAFGRPTCSDGLELETWSQALAVGGPNSAGDGLTLNLVTWAPSLWDAPTISERQKGGKAFRDGNYEEAMRLYNRAKAIVDFVRGSNSADQAEIDHAKSRNESIESDLPKERSRSKRSKKSSAGSAQHPRPSTQWCYILHKRGPRRATPVSRNPRVLYYLPRTFNKSYQICLKVTNLGSSMLRNIFSSRTLRATRNSRAGVRAVASSAMTPKLCYWPLKGRGEVIRLSLAHKGVAYEEVVVDRDEMKNNRETYPFGQCPRYIDGDIDLVQSNTIARFIGRKYGMMGETEKEHCMVDMVMEGVESLRSAYLKLIYQDLLSDEAKAAYWTGHFDKTSSTVRNGGAHALYLALILGKSTTGWVAGTSSASMADIALYDIVDLQLRTFKQEMSKEYPELVAHHAKVAELPGLKDYLKSEKCFAKANGNGLG
eukprot:gene15212-21289_t